MSKTNYPLVKVNFDEILMLSQNIAKKLKNDNKEIDLIIPILRGGMPAALLLSSILGVSEMSCLHIRRSKSDEPNTEFGNPVNKGITNSEMIENRRVLVVDDTLDSKKTLDYAIDIIKKYNPKSIDIAVLYNFNSNTFDNIYSGEEVKEYKWVIFPWEKSDENIK